MKTLVIVTQPPYQNRLANEQIEAIMSLALFDIDHSVVFLGEGLLWLIPGQQATSNHSVDKQLQALPLYGSESLYYVAEDQHYVLGESAVNELVKPVNRTELVQWMRQANHVEVF